MKKIEAIIGTAKFELVHSELAKVGISFMTYSEVKGIGMEHPTTQQYRGTSFDVGFIPRTRLEIVVPALAVGLFGQRSIDVQYWSETTSIKDGLFFGGGFDQLLIQATGVGAVFVYVFGSMLIIFFIIKKIVGLRVSDAEQLEGLDLGEHGNIAYGGFVLESTGPNAIISGHQTEKGTPG